MVSICLESTDIGTGTVYNKRLFDNPEQCPIFFTSDDYYVLGTGFDYRSPGVVNVPASGYLFWYRFTDRGMLLGYIVNPGSTSFNLPISDGLYCFSSTWNFNSYQLKFYLQCMDHDLYAKNNVSYYYNYYETLAEEAFSRFQKLDQLSAIQMKGFGSLSNASFMLLPYTFFNTFKFDFEYTMYNTDGTLKSNALYHAVMFADDGQLESDFDFHA